MLFGYRRLDQTNATPAISAMTDRMINVPTMTPV